MSASPRIALCLPGGGATGAMYQVGALAGLQDSVADLDCTRFDLYLGSSTGACVASALAGNQPATRLYKAMIDPADVYFPIQRSHVFHFDVGEWLRVARASVGAFSRGAESLARRKSAPKPSALWEELDRFYDSLPAGVFSLDRFERFLASVFDRRGVPNTFPAMERPLRIVAHDLDSGQRVLFGGAGFDHVPVSRACVCSMAYPPFFSPVRVGERHYIDTGAAQLTQLDVAVEMGAEVLVVVNPMVPVRAAGVPTGHGPKDSLRDKGYLWVTNQAIRIGMHALLEQALERIRSQGREVLLIEPDPGDAVLFMHSPASFSARRNILEHAYKTTREQLARLLDRGDPAAARAGWRPRPPERPSVPLPRGDGRSEENGR